MTRLFIARVRGLVGKRPLVTVRAAAAGEARLFLKAAYPEDEVVEVTEAVDWVSTSDTGTEAGDVREHPDTEWQASTTGL